MNLKYFYPLVTKVLYATIEATWQFPLYALFSGKYHLKKFSLSQAFIYWSEFYLLSVEYLDSYDLTSNVAVTK